jgi:hypothetical protein
MAAMGMTLPYQPVVRRQCVGSPSCGISGRWIRCQMNRRSRQGSIAATIDTKQRPPVRLSRSPSAPTRGRRRGCCGRRRGWGGLSRPSSRSRLGRAAASAIASFFLRSMERGPRPAKVEEPASVRPTSRRKQVPQRLWVCGLMAHGRMGRIASAEIVRLPFLPDTSWTMVSRGQASIGACGSFRSSGERFSCKFF